MKNSSTGYGVLAGNSTPNGHVASGDGTDSINNENIQGSSVLIKSTGESFGYGSLDNASVSTTDSYNRWYVEGFGNDYDICLSTSIHEASTAHGTPNSYYNRRQSNPYDSDFVGSGFYGDNTSLLENEGVSSQHVSQVLGYVSQEETENEHNYLPNSCERRITGIASTPLVAWNLINLLLSTSILAFPFVVQQGGYIVLPLILLMSILINYTSRILIDMMYEKSSVNPGRKIRVCLDYVDLGREVFNSDKGATFVQIIQLIEMLAICILNICVLGQLGQEITIKYSKQTCTIVAALFALPTFFIRRLVIIGWLQTIGVASLTIGLILVQGWCVAHAGQWDPSAIPSYNTRNIPIAIGVIIYAYGIQGVMPGLEEQMKKPRKFGYVVNLTFTIAFMVQCIFSVSNAMYYGERTAQVILIDLEDHFALGIASACFIGISILSHFSLPTLVVMEKLDNAILQTSSCCPTRQQNLHMFLRICLRITVMGLSLGIALLLPYFAYLMAFIGSAITVFISLLLPCTFHLKLRYDSISQGQIFIDVFVIVFALVCLGSGSYFSFESIYYDYVKNQNTTLINIL